MELPGNGRSGFRKVFEGKYDKDIRCVCNAAVLINKPELLIGFITAIRISASPAPLLEYQV